MVTSLNIFYLENKTIIYHISLFFFFLAALGFIAACGLSLVAASGGYSMLQCAGLLITVASLVAKDGL